MDFRKLVDKVLNKCTETFGEEIIIYPRAGGIYKVRGIFDNDFQVIDANLEQVVSGNQPAIGLNLNDVPIEIKKGDEVEVRTVRYKIQEKKEDGQGGATFLIHAMKVVDANKDTKSR